MGNEETIVKLAVGGAGGVAFAAVGAPPAAVGAAVVVVAVGGALAVTAIGKGVSGMLGSSSDNKKRLRR